MVAILPSTWQKLSLFKGRRPVLFWACFTIILILMFVPAIVLGLFFRLVKRTNAGNVTLTVDLGYSKYQGAYAANGVSQWFGIRYAAPPVGDLRFRAAADPLVNDTVQIADTVCFPTLVRKCSLLTISAWSIMSLLPLSKSQSKSFRRLPVPRCLRTYPKYDSYASSCLRLLPRWRIQLALQPEFGWQQSDLCRRPRHCHCYFQLSCWCPGFSY